MYTIKLLGPLLLGVCAGDLANGGGHLCNIDQQKPPVVKYYEPGKSCYVNGTFYSKCEDRLNGPI